MYPIKGVIVGSGRKYSEDYSTSNKRKSGFFRIKIAYLTFNITRYTKKVAE